MTLVRKRGLVDVVTCVALWREGGGIAAMLAGSMKGSAAGGSGEYGAEVVGGEA